MSSSSSIPATGSSTSLHTVTTTPILSSTDRPEITKSIDVWALGVTFYCLLFGTTPWVADTGTSGTGSEFSLYNAICNTDWTVSSTMGYDNIPTGGRHPDPDCEGASIIGLLDRFLQKDHKTRITLDQVKVCILNKLLIGFRLKTQSLYFIMVHRCILGFLTTWMTPISGFK